MIKIDEDTSQWGTVSNLVEFINKNELNINPFIVDIGAANGKLNSNSWPFINQGWLGVLVEPNPKPFAEMTELYHNYGVLLENAAVSAGDGTIILSMPESEADDQLASLAVNHPKKIEVKGITVKALIEKHDIKDVGILSVDTEGYDYQVVQMWMQTDNRPQVVITESWPHLPYVNMAKTSLLGTNGYKKVLHCGENEIFIKKELL